MQRNGLGYETETAKQTPQFLFYFSFCRVQHKTPHVHLLHFETKLPIKREIPFLNVISVLSGLAATAVKRLRGAEEPPVLLEPAGLEAGGDLGQAGESLQESSVPVPSGVSMFLQTNFFGISWSFVHVVCLGFIIALSNEELTIN